MDEINIVQFFQDNKLDISTEVECLKKKLMNIFLKWKSRYGEQPQQEGSILTGFCDVPLETAPPYKCAGKDVHGYTELLWRIRSNEQSMDLLMWSMVAFELDRECMNSSAFTIEGRYLLQTKLKISDMKASLDEPILILGRKKIIDDTQKMKHLQKVLPPVTDDEAKDLLSECLEYGIEHTNLNLTAIREHVGEEHSPPRAVSTVATYTRDLKALLKTKRQSVRN